MGISEASDIGDPVIIDSLLANESEEPRAKSQKQLLLRTALDRLTARFREENLGNQKDSADDDGAVGNVEGWPVVRPDVEVEKIDDMAVDDAVPEIAEGAAQDERQANGHCAYRMTILPEQNGNDDESDQ